MRQRKSRVSSRNAPFGIPRKLMDRLLLPKQTVLPARRFQFFAERAHQAAEICRSLFSEISVQASKFLVRILPPLQKAGCRSTGLTYCRLCKESQAGRASVPRLPLSHTCKGKNPIRHATDAPFSSEMFRNLHPFPNPSRLPRDRLSFRPRRSRALHHVRQHHLLPASNWPFRSLSAPVKT